MGHTTVIAGFSSTDKVPGGYGEVIYGAGAVSAADIPLELLLVGLLQPSVGATASPDVDIVDIVDGDTANAAFGARSQLARMCRAALHVDGVTIKAIAVTDGGGAAATLTFTVTGTWSTNGSYTFRLGGEVYAISVTSTDVLVDVSTKIRDAINANATGFAVGTRTAGVATATVASLGPHGNDYIGFGDQSLLPAGCVVTITGGSAVTGGGLRFTGGTTAENVTTALATLFPTQYDRIALAQNDATNLGRWRTQVNTQASATEGRRQHIICASNGSLSTATGLASTTLNSARFQVAWMLNAETHPSEIAAVLAAVRTQGEQGDPGQAYDGYVLPGVVPSRFRADWAQHSTLVTALNSGVTPITSTATDATVCRSIVTKCLNGTSPDYRVLDTSDAYVPDYVLDDLLLLWATDFRVANPRVRDNPAPEEPEVADGVATPDIWNRVVIARFRRFERGDGLPYPILSSVSQHLPNSNWDASAKRIMTVAPVVPAANQHQVGISVRQLAA